MLSWQPSSTSIPCALLCFPLYLFINFLCRFVFVLFSNDSQRYKRWWHPHTATLFFLSSIVFFPVSYCVRAIVFRSIFKMSTCLNRAVWRKRAREMSNLFFSLIISDCKISSMPLIQAWAHFSNARSLWYRINCVVFLSSHVLFVVLLCLMSSSFIYFLDQTTFTQFMDSPYHNIITTTTTFPPIQSHPSVKCDRNSVYNYEAIPRCKLSYYPMISYHTDMNEAYQVCCTAISSVLPILMH